MKRIFLVAGLLLLCSCKSGEEKYCERAKAQNLYDPLRPGLCQESYRKLTTTERDCIDKCIAKTPDAIGCDGTCNIDRPTGNMHHPPPGNDTRPGPSASR